MTSTVLDVTVLLLCVSASVVALGAADSDSETAGPEAAEVADLIATETVTVTYASDEAPNRTRTVHATRAELLALVAAGGGGGGGKRASREAFESEALAAIERGLGPRTRIDAEVETEASGDLEKQNKSEAGSRSPDAAVGSAHQMSNAPASPTGPGRWRFDSDVIDRASAGSAGTGVPWRIDREESGDGSRKTEGQPTGSDSPNPVTVGSAPPQGADVTVAVITHPLSNDSDKTRTVRIVVRRW
ncbi:DUF7284 family protein [Halorubrum sp. N11]|uniref:DUF7284 family protein n=1 Tax=Halorubrum sp. N11 TaxID=3402276 RepID=UPI003EB809C3